MLEPPKFGISEQRTERQILFRQSITITTLRFENLMTALSHTSIYAPQYFPRYFLGFQIFIVLNQYPKQLWKFKILREIAAGDFKLWHQLHIQGEQDWKGYIIRTIQISNVHNILALHTYTRRIKFNFLSIFQRF